MGCVCWGGGLWMRETCRIKGKRGQTNESLHTRAAHAADAARDAAPGGLRKQRPPGGASRTRAGDRQGWRRLNLCETRAPWPRADAARGNQGCPSCGRSNSGSPKKKKPQSIQTSTPDLVYAEVSRGGAAGARARPSGPRTAASPRRPGPPRPSAAHL